MSDTQSDADVETLVKTEPMPLTSAVSESGDLTIIEGIGGKMAAALKAAGIDTVGKLAQASDETLRAAIEAAGIRLAPSLPAWRDQALLLIKGDQAGFEALKKKLASARRGQQ